MHTPVLTEARAHCAVDGTVLKVDVPCREHVRIEVLVPTLPGSHPGQFLQVRCSEDAKVTAGNTTPTADLRDGSPPTSAVLGDADFRCERPYLRRPFSIADRWDEHGRGAHLQIISHTVGPGTQWLARLAPGDTLNLTGPLGHGFSIPDARRCVILVGGGVGIPPLLYMARVLRKMDWPAVRIILGARTRELFCVPLIREPPTDGTPSCCVELPGSAGYPTIVTSDDGSLGLRGQATTALERLQRCLPAGHPPPWVLACGPDAMLRAVAALTAAWAWKCQLCIEKNMSCGIGTCLSCVVRVADPSRPLGWRWALSCSDGPVFDRDELLDYLPDGGSLP